VNFKNLSIFPFYSDKKKAGVDPTDPTDPTAGASEGWRQKPKDFLFARQHYFISFFKRQQKKNI
jgi:hypothetical protein